MPRRVAVELDLVTARYMAEARKVEVATKVVDEDMKALGRAADAAGRDMDQLAAQTELAKRQVKDLGDKSRTSAAEVKLLDERIKATKASVRTLGLEFAATGDKAAGTQLNRERSLLGRLEKLRKELTAFEQPTSGFGVTLPGGHGVMSIAAPAIGAAAPALTALGAMIGGAVAGATGTAALAAGIASASKDAQVRAAAVEAGHNIAAEFFSGGGAFVEPTVDAIHTIERAFSDMHIGDALAKVAPEVRVIAGGFADFARNVMPGVNEALDRMAPYAVVAAKGIADMGTAVGDFLDEVTQSPGTLEGLDTLFHGLNVTIRFTGESIDFLSERFHTMLQNSATLSGWLEDWYPTWYPLHDIFAKINDDAERMLGLDGSLHGTMSKLNKEAVDPFAGYLHHAWQEMEQLRGETEATRKSLLDYWQTLRGMDDANIAWEQSIDDLTKSVQENGRTLDIHTDKGRNNIRAVDDAISAAQRQYEQGKITAKQYDDQIKQIIDIGVQAGLSRKQLEDLAGKYEIALLVNLIGAPVVAGMAKVLGNAVSNFFGHTPAAGTGRPGHESFAAGGTTPAFAPFEVHSGEMLWSNREHYVSTAAQSTAMAQQWQAGPSSGSQPIVIENHITLIDPMTGAKTRQNLITDAVNRGKPSSQISAAYP
jgi:hypothetical protein